MTCSVYQNCQQISKKLCKITNDLNRILSEVQSPCRPVKCNKKTSTFAKTLQQTGGTISDWYLRPMHLSSTTPIRSKDPVRRASSSVVVHPSPSEIAPAADPPPGLKNNDTMALSNYIPGTVGSIIADVRKDMEKENLVQQPEESEKRRKNCSRNYKPNKVFSTPCRDLDAELEDYIDEQDLDNLSLYGTETDDKVKDTINNSKLQESKDQVMSPFYAKLAQLRMEELLLEEERLLELKRIQELIRTRRPRKFWYMLRSKQFTEELMRNTDMIRNAQYQKDIDRYRAELIRASLKTGKQFWKPTS